VISEKKYSALEESLKNNADKEQLSREGLTPLQFALKIRESNSFRILLEHGADPKVSFDDGDNIITKAARNMDPVFISILMDNGIDCNSYDGNGKTPLICAIEDYADESAKVLLKNKANINLVSKKDKQTPLHYAVSRNNKAVVQRLLLLGADVSKKDSEGLTPADYAQKYGFIEILKLLNK
jgi:ankyrin repeat protein